jgi:hypothetical protein
MSNSEPAEQFFTKLYMSFVQMAVIPPRIFEFSTINSNKSPTRCNNFLVHYPDVYLKFNMFRAFSRPRTQHGYHHDTKVKPEAATAVIELLRMGGRTPEIC